MPEPFPIIEISANTDQDQEPMGTKQKFWLRHPDLGQCLFKVARPKTGEDWSEKIAAELCDLLGLPHARYELATWQDYPGIVSPTFLPKNTTLLHGNDILAGLVSSYPKDMDYKQSQHTLTNVINALSSEGLRLPLDWNPPDGITSPVSVFAGYLLLDAWIGNGDRHHENWGFVLQLPQGIPHLAPTYDHASCLGRELQDIKRERRLQNKTVTNYAKKSRSAFYANVNDRKTITTFDTFTKIATKYPKSAAIWLNHLAQITHTEVNACLSRIPNHRISPAALEFTEQMLSFNQTRLLNLQEELS
ncbi:MAG: HipA-like protein [Cyanobacteria bacterium P01_D01_bin.156]